MIIDRPMLKARSKEILRASYLKSVAVSLVLFITLYGAAGSSATNSGASPDAVQTGSYVAAIPMSFAALLIGFAGILMIIMLIIRVFVLNVLFFVLTVLYSPALPPVNINKKTDAKFSRRK